MEAASAPVFRLWNAKLPNVAPTTGSRIVRGPNIAWPGIRYNAMVPPKMAANKASVGGNIAAIVGVTIIFNDRKLGAPINMLIGIRLVTT